MAVEQLENDNQVIYKFFFPGIKMTVAFIIIIKMQLIK
jgi:hypothetical protein